MMKFCSALLINKVRYKYNAGSMVYFERILLHKLKKNANLKFKQACINL